METVKSRDRIHEPDPRSACFAKMDPVTGKTELMTLEDQYAVAENYRLHDGVPEDIRSYMATVVTVWLFGWFHYPFYTLAQFLSTTAVEMALKKRLSEGAGRRRKGLRALLEEAKTAGLLCDEGFRSLKRVEEDQASFAVEIGDAVDEPGSNSVPGRFVDRVVSFYAGIRNSFAHPTIHTILFPGQTVGAMILASEIINQLWSDPAS
jgi:hypothetical protein